MVTQADTRRRIAVFQILNGIERRRPYPGQRYRHGWIPVVGLPGDPLNMKAHADAWLTSGDQFEGSARIDGINGRTAAMMFGRDSVDGQPWAVLATLPADEVDTWRASDDDDSVAYLAAEDAGEVAKNLERLIAGIRRDPERPKTVVVSGTDIGNVELRASDGGIDVLAASYRLDTDDEDYLKDRVDERRQLVKDLRRTHVDDDDEDLTPDELAAIRQEIERDELAEFDQETQDELREAKRRRDAHTVRLNLEQAAMLAEALRELGDDPPA
jgi:hypothetical protein